MTEEAHKFFFFSFSFLDWVISDPSTLSAVLSSWNLLSRHLGISKLIPELIIWHKVLQSYKKGESSILERIWNGGEEEKEQ